MIILLVSVHTFHFITSAFSTPKIKGFHCFLSNVVREVREMEINSELVRLGIDLGNIVARNGAQSIMDKIKSIKTTGDNKKIVGNLEEIINDLISDKNQLIQLAQSYEEVVILQKISDEDIDYITTSIVPLLGQLLSQNEGEDATRARAALELFEPILSKETFNILQLLGFNFKKAIGEPLTELANAAIVAKKPMSTEDSIELRMLAEQRQIEYLKIMQDEEAFRRLLRAEGRE